MAPPEKKRGRPGKEAAPKRINSRKSNALSASVKGVLL